MADAVSDEPASSSEENEEEKTQRRETADASASSADASSKAGGPGSGQAARKAAGEEPEDRQTEATSAEATSTEETRGEDERNADASLPLGVDLAEAEPEEDFPEKNISFSISVRLHGALQKRLLGERISMRRALAGIMRWWTEEPEKAGKLLRPQIERLRARKNDPGENEEEGQKRGSSFRVNEQLHNNFRMQLIDEDLFVKDATETMIRWFVEEPAEVRANVRGHLPPSRQ